MNDKKIVSKKNSDYFFTEVYVRRTGVIPDLVKPILEQPNTVIRWRRYNSLYQACNHLVPFLLVTQITPLKKSCKGVIYEESLDRRPATTSSREFLY